MVKRKRQRPPADETVVYYARSGDEAIARAAVRVFRGCIDDVLVYKESNRLTSALYRLNEGELGQPFAPEQDPQQVKARVLGEPALRATKVRALRPPTRRGRPWARPAPSQGKLGTVVAGQALRP